MWVQVRLAAERGLGLTATVTTPLDVATGAVEVPKPPPFDAMLRAIRKAHPSLTKPPVGTTLSLPAPSMLALLRFLDSLDAEKAADEDAMAVDTPKAGTDAMEEDPADGAAEKEATAGKYAEGFLLLLEHALVRYALLTPRMPHTAQLDPANTDRRLTRRGAFRVSCCDSQETCQPPDSRQQTQVADVQRHAVGCVDTGG